MRQTVSLLKKTYEVSNGFNLYIDISSACNASCKFCIAPTIGRKDGPKFFDGVKFALDFTESINGTIQIIGGEPMISRRLPALLKEIGMRNYRRAVVNTNGSFISDEIISAIKSANITHVNISRHHYDEQQNQEIMKLRPKLPNNEIASSVSSIINSGVNVRMQCNLIKGYIDSKQSILKYIDWCINLGCRDISFSQVFPLGLFDYQVPPEVGYTEKVQIDLRKLVSEIDTCGKFLPVPKNQLRGERMSMWGHDNYGSAGCEGARRRFWFGPEGTYLSLKTFSGYDKDGLPKDTRYNKENDWELSNGILAFAVLHSDGLVTASWDRRERLLFSPHATAEDITFQRQTFPVLSNTNMAIA